MLSFSSAKDVESFHLKMGLSQNFCIAPFTTLLLEPDGKIGACRHKGAEFPVGNILHQSFDEIWNGPFIKNWRAEFLAGKPQICSTEVKDRKCHHCPSYNQLLQNADIHVHQTKKPLRIAFNFNGHCNLECNMCHIWQKENGLYDKIKFWENIDPWIEDLEEVELLSGEPFIQKDTYRLIEIISAKKPLARWTFTTNANWKLSEYIKSHLDKIIVKNMIVSLDATTEETYSKIRKKGDFKKAIETIRQLQSYEKNRLEQNLSPLNLKVNFLFQKENWQELERVSEFGRNESIEIFRTFLYEPFELSLLNLTENEKIQKLDWYIDNMTTEDIQSSFRVLRPLMDSLTPINKFYFYDKIRSLVL